MSAWEDLGAVSVPPVWPKARPGALRPPKGTAAWEIADPNEPDRTSWRIHAARRPGLDDRGPDAWRVTVQHYDATQDPHGATRSGWFHDFEVIVDSEVEALSVVKWLLAEANEES